MPRIPRPWYADGAWRTDFGGTRNRILIRGPEDADTRLLAEKELIRLREEAKVLQRHTGMNTPFGVVVEEFLEGYVGRPAYQDFFNELHWFMGGSTAAQQPADEPTTKRGKNRPNGGRFGIPCKSWSVYRINADLVERYLRKRRAPGLSGYHAFVTIRTVLNWAKKKGYLPTHDLANVDKALRRRGRRRYMPPDEDVVRVFNGAEGDFQGLLLAFMYTGVRPKELMTVTVDEFDRDRHQWVLWRHKTVDRTGMPKVVPLASDQLQTLCVASAGDRTGDYALFLSPQGHAWSYNALRLRWSRLRKKLGLDPRFTLYTLRHWYLTMAIERLKSNAHQSSSPPGPLLSHPQLEEGQEKKAVPPQPLSGKRVVPPILARTARRNRHGSHGCDRLGAKIAVARSMSVRQDGSRFWDLIIAFNALRNNLAHELESPKRQAKIDAVKTIYFQLRDPGPEADEEQKWEDHLLCSAAASYCAGFLVGFEAEVESIREIVDRVIKME